MVKRHLSLKNYGSVSNNPQGKAAHARIVNGFKIFSVFRKEVQ
jgi:hypothetical protein